MNFSFASYKAAKDLSIHPRTSMRLAGVIT